MSITAYFSNSSEITFMESNSAILFLFPFSMGSTCKRNDFLQEQVLSFMIKPNFSKVIPLSKDGRIIWRCINASSNKTCPSTGLKKNFVIKL